jgi:hypothetical protein
MKKMALRYFETSVTIYTTTEHPIPEEFNIQQHRCENLKLCYLGTRGKLRNLVENLKDTNLENVGVDGRVKLKLVLQKQGTRLGNLFTWARTGTMGGGGVMKIRFRKMCGIC